MLLRVKTTFLGFNLYVIFLHRTKLSINFSRFKLICEQTSNHRSHFTTGVIFRVVHVLNIHSEEKERQHASQKITTLREMIQYTLRQDGNANAANRQNLSYFLNSLRN